MAGAVDALVCAAELDEGRGLVRPQVPLPASRTAPRALPSAALGRSLCRPRGAARAKQCASPRPFYTRAWRPARAPSSPTALPRPFWAPAPPPLASPWPSCAPRPCRRAPGGPHAPHHRLPLCPRPSGCGPGGQRAGGSRQRPPGPLAAGLARKAACLGSRLGAAAGRNRPCGPFQRRALLCSRGGLQFWCRSFQAAAQRSSKPAC
jgi:hypothetical protein